MNDKLFDTVLNIHFFFTQNGYKFIIVIFIIEENTARFNKNSLDASLLHTPRELNFFFFGFI